MKRSFSSATAILRGFAGWVSGRTSNQIYDEAHVPFVVSACGYQSRDEGDSVEKTGRSDALRDRWPPGLNVDNFS
ncbi:MAG: hypothetical protein EKK38_16325 [Hyphomicrobium sp.]|nr:MAG: hypothetical protein EKK38_16325 [Hyphomicrobium sp.]